ncbi:hypothetical protein ANO11243_076360 [Dothideomycetidae sp. 11243]|nr:hypothetical protein ANO11243_076360 [fungal sp. No.11243]
MTAIPPSSPGAASLHESDYSAAVPAPTRLRRLYISHFLSAWNVRLIEFGSVLFIAQLYPTTLLPASVYALVRASSAIVFASAVGSLVDRLNRLHTIWLSIGLQRVSTAVLCGLLFILANGLPSTYLERVVLALLSVFGGLEKLAAMGNTIAVERDWVVLIAGDSEESLQKINSRMRRIDLFCKLVAPISVALIASVSIRTAILSIMLLTTLSFPLEYILIAQVYHRTKELHSTPNGSLAGNDGQDGNDGHLKTFTPGPRQAWSDLTYYCLHPAFLPSFALSLLYLTVFSFGGQMISYLTSISYSTSTIGALRTVAAVAELSATFVAPLVMRRIGVIRCGIRLLNAQLVCVLMATAMLWLPQDNISTSIVFLIAVIMSRIGLWSFDLSAQILIQENVEPEGRGRFSSIEAGFQNAFELCSYASTVVFARPDQFRYPATVTAFSVACATIVFSVYTRQKRGHLFHAPACIDCCKNMSSKSSMRSGWIAVPQGDEQSLQRNMELEEI